MGSKDWQLDSVRGGGYILNCNGMIVCFSEKGSDEELRKREELSTGLKDYKLYCFNGTVKLFLITQDRSKGETTGDYFDAANQHLDLTWGFPKAKEIPMVPANIEKMKELAEKLSVEMPELRVDFYDINGSIYFGELTFFDGSGFECIEPNYYDQTMGKWIDLTLL